MNGTLAGPGAPGQERWAGLGGGGHGIIGMRERAAMLGGHLQAGPTANDEFLVTAALPLGDGGGHGIIGMRERAAMLGGNLEARPAPNGEFLVTAALPLGSDPEGAP